MPLLWHNDGLDSYSPAHIPIQNGEVYKEVDHSHDHHHGGHHYKCHLKNSIYYLYL